MTDNKLVTQTSSLQKFSSLNKYQINQLILSKLDENEADGKNQFHDLNDMTVIAYYLSKDKHIILERNVSDSTLSTYTRVITTFYNHLCEYSDEINLDFPTPFLLENGEFSMLRSLQRRHIRRYVEWLKNSSPYVTKRGSYKLSSLSHKLLIIKGFLKKLYMWGVIEIPLHEDIPVTSVSDEDRPNRDAGAAHVLFLLRLFERNDNTAMFGIIHFLTTTGIRNSEMCALKIGDLELDHQTGGFIMNVIAKGSKQRKIPLKEKTMRAINIFRRGIGLPIITIQSINSLNMNDPVFATNRGKPFSASYLVQFIHRHINNLNEKDKYSVYEMFSYKEHENPTDKESPIIMKPIVITPHLFRHAFAIISSKVRNTDIYSISRSLGHANISTTRIYLEKVYAVEDNVIHKWDSSVFGEFI